MKCNFINIVTKEFTLFMHVCMFQSISTLKLVLVNSSSNLSVILFEYFDDNIGLKVL